MPRHTYDSMLSTRTTYPHPHKAIHHISYLLRRSVLSSSININIYIYKISHSCKDEVSGVGAERDGGIANQRSILREIRAPRSSLCSTSSFHRIPTP
ncbi:unnamed protein product [Citrullus colocynthis]|uniref:Uncharacterized protein n=1 Tax=Citrullus colocynthis TaxID=252529 RepID=A0ABP0Y8L3_9ROSI